MFWQEDEDKSLPYQVSEDIVDLSFALQCKRLPLDHAWALSQAIQTALPWFADEADAGLHLIHVAETGNGWMRPENPEYDVLHLSRRTRMQLRLPKHRIADAQQLTGHTLDIDGFPLKVGASKKKTLVNQSTVFSRYVLCEPDENEDRFLYRCAEEIMTLTGVKIRKMMCGKQSRFKIPEAKIYARNLMVADLDSEAAIKLQQKGIGKGRKMGFGLFLPHKGIKSVKGDE